VLVENNKKEIEKLYEELQHKVEKELRSRDANRPELQRKSQIHQIQITKEINIIEKDREELTVNYLKTIAKYNQRVEGMKKEIHDSQQQIQTLKLTLNFLLTDQQNYYLDILRKGIDVRSEGLCWTVKKLIELNCHLDPSMFPKNLDHEQIDYILSLSYKHIEIQQLKGILRVLKQKQQDIRINQNNELFGVRPKSKQTMSNFFQSFTSTTPKTHMSMTKTNLSKQMLTMFDTLNKNEATKENYEQRMEDAQVKNFLTKIDGIVENLKKKIKMHKEHHAKYSV
jgi:hypothetical protein